MIDHAENAIATALHVVVGTNAAKHRRQPQIRPRLVAQIPARRTKDAAGCIGTGGTRRCIEWVLMLNYDSAEIKH